MSSTGWIYTENYMWKTTNYIGQGATAKVYQGVHRQTGDPVAVKCFLRRDKQWLRAEERRILKEIEEKQMKELDILGELDHENVIKLLGVETEVDSKEKVAVMELCDSKSLFYILNDPENIHGMNEDEFLLLLSHLTAGLKYLRDKHISHRDIKPGNIVKYITPEGRHIYKLADFGTARVLLENEYFQSICGTEEYLDPDMYEKALIKRSSQSCFTPTVDLWSMGCTIYHAATGVLPFQPYRRRDKEAMHYIHLNKPAGAISAIQHENGHVDWHSELPKKCLLSRGLRKMVTNLLQKLLTKEATMSFTEFFSEMETILSKQKIHVFDVQYCTEHTVYVHPDTTIAELQLEIEKLTSVSSEKQMLIQEGALIDDLDSSGLVRDVLKVTSQTKPLILLSLTQLGLMFTHKQASALQVNFPKFEKHSKIDEDIHVAETFTSEAYVAARHVARLGRCYNLLLNVPSVVMSVFRKRVEDLSKTSQQISKDLAVKQDVLMSLDKHTLSVMEFVPLLGTLKDVDVKEVAELILKRKQELQSILQLLNNVVNGSSNLTTKYGLKLNNKSYLWPGLQRFSKLTHSKETADTHVNAIRKSWMSLDSFFKNSSARSFDAQDYVLEKIIITQTAGKLLALNKECTSSLQDLILELDSWYSEFQPDLVKCDCLKLELKCIADKVKSFEAALEDSGKESETMISLVSSKVKSFKEEHQRLMFRHISRGLNPDGNHNNAKPKLFEELDGIGKAQQDMRKVIEENVSLLKTLQNFSDQLCLHSNGHLTVENKCDMEIVTN